VKLSISFQTLGLSKTLKINNKLDSNKIHKQLSTYFKLNMPISTKKYLLKCYMILSFPIRQISSHSRLNTQQLDRPKFKIQDLSLKKINVKIIKPLKNSIKSLRSIFNTDTVSISLENMPPKAKTCNLSQ